ncbi:MAG: nucleotide kinase domain-containing protein [Candidatus Thiodiazotropha endolucinida]
MAIPSLRHTEVFDTFWTFAVKRQELFFKRIEFPLAESWTDDPILKKHKFTNAYRAADRVSQYLIRNVIYSGNDSPEEVFFRIILFKLFNKIETWELLIRQLGNISWEEYSFSRFDSVLSTAMGRGERIYSAAYIMASGRSAFGHEKKHQNHLRLIEKMMEEELYLKICDAKSFVTVFNLLKSEPGLGDFLAYQFAIDLNYSELIDFSENDFVVPGPGALRGVRKAFSNTASIDAGDIIKYTTEHQEKFLEERNLKFQNLWGRQLHLIDVQNLFCEVDKYSRVYHPEINCKDGRKRIKQKFKPNSNPITYWFPPKWGVEINMDEYVSSHCATLF